MCWMKHQQQQQQKKMVSVNKDMHAGSNTTRASNKLNIYLLFTIDSTIVIRRFSEQFQLTPHTRQVV